MKKNLLLVVGLVFLCVALVFAGCTQQDATDDNQQQNEENVDENVGENNGGEAEVETQYISKEDLKAVIDDATAGYVLVDLRKAADYEAGHIVTAVSADIDSAVSNGDNDTAIANLEAALEAATGDKLGGDNNIVLICYSGNKYAATGTDLLIGMGVDPTQLYTLTDGNNAWAEDEAYSEYLVTGTEPGTK